MTCVYDRRLASDPRDVWLCNESVDPTCPIEPPTDGTSAQAGGMRLLDIECECVGKHLETARRTTDGVTARGSRGAQPLLGQRTQSVAPSGSARSLKS